MELIPESIQFILQNMTIFRFDAIVNEFGDTVRVMSEAFGKLNRVLGYYKNEFIKAWELNTETQHLELYQIILCPLRICFCFVQKIFCLIFQTPFQT